jgi:hypothetical protein
MKRIGSGSRCGMLLPGLGEGDFVDGFAVGQRDVFDQGARADAHHSLPDDLAAKIGLEPAHKLKD